jgi:hypothetical protein
MNREQLLRLATSGTVTFPPVFPHLAELEIAKVRDLPVAIGPDTETYVIATERPSAKVSIKRSVVVSEVRALFLPRDVHRVNLNDGTWLIRHEIEPGLRTELLNRHKAFGILYVAEYTATLLEVHAGMTAAESAQYYPPLPIDRSVNHYDPHRQCDPPQYPAPCNEQSDYPPRPPHAPAPADPHSQPTFNCDPFRGWSHRPSNEDRMRSPSEQRVMCDPFNSLSTPVDQRPPYLSWDQRS